MAILDQFYKPDILKGETFQFSENENYLVPKMTTVEGYMEYIETLQIQDDPDIFGMHENANLTYQSQQSDIMLKEILNLQPLDAGGAEEGGSVEDVA